MNSPASHAPTPQDHIRILRSATHWAMAISPDFSAIAANCGGSLVLTQGEGGAITLTGHTITGLPVSICLAPGTDGPELHLLMAEVIVREGFASIRKTEIHLTLPRQLAQQLAHPQVAA